MVIWLYLIWLNFEFPNNTVYEDFHIDFFVLFEAKKFCAINKLVYNYTRHSSATSAYKKFSYEKFRNFTYQVFYFLKAVYIDPRFKKEEYKKCLATWFSAVAVVCAEWNKLAKSDPKYRWAFQKFKMKFIHEFMVKNKLSSAKAWSWWSIHTTNVFNTLFAKEIKYWKKQMQNKK